MKEKARISSARIRAVTLTYEEMFRDEEVYDHKEDEAARRSRDWCRERVLDELDKREGTSTTDHLRTALSVIEGDAAGPLRRYR